MHVAIVGGRDYPALEDVQEFVVKYIPDGTTVVSGGAPGVDTVAVLAALECGLDTVVLRPDWKRFGNSAGFRRNKDIVKQSDFVIAFWDGTSKGTLHTINLARKAGKMGAVYMPGFPMGGEK